MRQHTVKKKWASHTKIGVRALSQPAHHIKRAVTTSFIGVTVTPFMVCQTHSIGCVATTNLKELNTWLYIFQHNKLSVMKQVNKD